LNSEPRNRAGVSVYQGYGGMQEIGYLLLLARLRLEHRVHIWSLLSPALREACPASVIGRLILLTLRFDGRVSRRGLT
jgi:hypothetical protein